MWVDFPKRHPLKLDEKGIIFFENGLISNRRNLGLRLALKSMRFPSKNKNLEDLSF